MAFTLHDGSQYSLALLRFIFGAAAALAYLAVFRPARPALREVKGARALLMLSGFCGASAIALMMVAARHTSVLVITLLGLSSPALLAFLAPMLGLPSGSRRQASWAVVAVLSAGVAGVMSGSTGEGTFSGAVLAAIATLLGVVSGLSAALVASVRHPAQVLVSICLWGVVIMSSAVALGASWSAPPSTVLAAAFIALLPGGVATAAVIWAQARVAPYLVSATGSAALVSAGVLGWMLLGQRPSSVSVLCSLVVVVAVTLMQKDVRHGRLRAG